MIFMRRRLYLLCYLTVIFILFASFLSIANSTLGDGADAQLHDVEVIASPSVQGIGGYIEVDAAVLFYGGCCYHLYAYDVKAYLTAPEGLEIIEGPTPEVHEEVDAKPGGIATVVNFNWRVMSSIKGLYNLSFLIETKNCGSFESNVNVEFVKGCSISPPELYPKQPSVNKENIIYTNASTALEGREVESLTFYYVMGEGLDDAMPANDTLQLPDGIEEKGVPTVMEKDPYQLEQWTCKLNIKTPGRINFWFVATDDSGENTTSSLYSMDVVDQEAVDSIVTVIFWALIVAIIFGLISIFLVHAYHLENMDSKKGVLLPEKKEDHEDEIGIKSNKIRTLITITLLVIAILTLAIAVIMGLIGEVFDLVM